MIQKTWIALFILILVSRGVLQLLMPTPMAMVVHVALVALFTISFAWQHRDEFSSRLLPLLFWSGAFLVCVIISAALTTYQGLVIWPIYLVFTVYSVVGGVLLARLSQSSSPHIPFAKILLWTGWLLFFVALLEQFNLFEMPGASRFVIARPASITGSMLHYPIILALIAFCLLQWHEVTKKRAYLFCGGFFCLAQVMALSRSGMLIVGAGYGLVVLMTIIQRPQAILKAAAVVALVLLLLGVALWSDPEALPHKVALRIVTAADVHAPGNADRVNKWMISTSRWLDTNGLFGETTGLATNSSLRFGSRAAFITESGFFQQLLNYGLLGVVTYYGFLICLGLLIRKEHLFLRGVFFASLLETLIYQSVEVVSFMTLLCMLPWISQSYAYFSQGLETTETTGTAGTQGLSVAVVPFS